MSNSPRLLSPVTKGNQQVIYCLICVVDVVREQLAQARQGIPELEMMVHAPQPAITWGLANVNGKENVVPLCGKPEHLGIG